MKEYVVYILWSSAYNKTYIGFTSNLIARFHSHNNLGKKGWTKRYRPWSVVFVAFFSSKKEALFFEKFLKSGVGSACIAKNILFE